MQFAPRLPVAILTVALLVPVAVAAPVPMSVAPRPGETPVAKARQALHDSADFRFEQASLDDLARFVRSRFGIELTLDANALLQSGLNANTPVVNADLKGATLRDGLKAALAPVGLRFAVTAEGIVVSTDEGVIQRQMRQRVNVEGGGRSLAAVLAEMAATTGANVVLDPRQAKVAGESPISVSLQDTPLETAVRVVAEVAGLRAVRLNNVLFVTSDDRAAKLRPDADGPVPPTPVSPFPQPPPEPFVPPPAAPVALPVPAPQPLPPVEAVP